MFNPKLSLYIPRVHKSVTVEYMKKIFEEQERIGEINNIVIRKSKCGKYSFAWVYFNYWKENKATRELQENLNNTGGHKLHHLRPWYWILLKNTSKNWQDFIKVPDDVVEESDYEGPSYDDCGRDYRQDNWVSIIDMRMSEKMRGI